jgi:single-stranded-DNA-specific exonuclease
LRIETRQSTNRLGLDDDLLDRVFTARGITELAQLEKGLTNLLSPADLPEIDQAALRLADAVEGDEKILIVGDFDADGATSVALCLLALGATGCRRKLCSLQLECSLESSSPSITASPA